MSKNDELNRDINHYVPPNQGPKTCPGCKGKGWQKRNDGIKVTCPMCGGSGNFIPAGTITFKAKPTITIRSCPCPHNPEESKPAPGHEFIPPPGIDNPRYPHTWPWWRTHYTGDIPDDRYRPRTIC